MQSNESIRETVSRTYGKLVSSNGPQSCCGTMPKGTLARRAGYSNEELQTVPSEAVANSFGCGHPLAFSEVREGDTVLDLGCGAGIDVLLAARKVGPGGRAIGVDMTDEMIAKARGMVAEAGLTNAEIRKGLIEELPVESGSVDWVISNCVINLSPEKGRVFAEIARVLKPGGQARVSDIIAEDLPDAVREDLRMYSSCVGGAISEDEYRAGLQRAGFTDVRIVKRQELSVAQLEALLESDRSAFQDGGGCCGGGDVTSAPATEWATGCESRVWSAEISARKPM